MEFINLKIISATKKRRMNYINYIRSYNILYTILMDLRGAHDLHGFHGFHGPGAWSKAANATNGDGWWRWGGDGEPRNAGGAEFSCRR